MQFKLADLTFLVYCISMVTAAPAAADAELSVPISQEEATAHYALAARQLGGFGGTGTTSNDIKEGKCAPLTWIFARGSTEPGNMGTTVGPSVAKYLKAGGDVAVQGVTYTASIASNALGGRPGGQVMASLIKEAKQKCPNTKIAIGGYSQGGMVTHVALGQVQQGDVAAAITYGDPFERSSFKNIDASDTKKFCNPSDGVCKTGGFAITPGHLTYTTNGDTKAGADFIRQIVGSGGSGGSSSSAGSDGTDASGSSDSGSDSSSSGGLGGLSSLGGGASSLGGLSSLGGGVGGLGSLEGGSDSSSSDSGDSSSAMGGLSGLGSLSSLGGGGSALGSGSLSSLGGGGSELGSLSSLGGGL